MTRGVPARIWLVPLTFTKQEIEMSGNSPWPYTKAMHACRRQRQMRAWYNRVFTSDRVVNIILITFFFVMVYIYVFELHQ